MLSAAESNVVQFDTSASEAEQSLLGALLLDNSKLAAIPWLKAVHFVDPGHGLIFGHTIRLIEAGLQADVITLSDSLRKAEKLDTVGGLAYLGQLVANVPSVAGAATYAHIVHHHFLRRALIVASLDIVALANATGTQGISTLLDAATERLLALRTSLQFGDGPAPLDLAALSGRRVPEREYRVGQIMSIGTIGEWSGHGGAGKTQCALHLAVCLALGLPFFGEPVKASRVVFASGEDDDLELWRRVVQQADTLGVPLLQLAERLFVYDLTRGEPTLLAVGQDKRVVPTPLYAWLKGEIERRQVDVVILDNRATLFDGDGNVPGFATRAMTLFSNLAPPGGNVIVLAHVDKQTARSGYSREAYSGTSAWHNRARVRWYLYQPNAQEDADGGDEPAADDGRRVLEVQKNNAGPVGTRFRLRLVDGAIVADGETGIVASIARDLERKAVIEALREARHRKVDVPSNTGGPSTAYQALQTMPSYPESLRGRNGKKRLFRLLHQLRTDSVLEDVEFTGSGRHKRRGYRIVGES